jgi:hypothetical protein
MTRARPIPFVELRRLLQEMGYKGKHTDKAWIFQHAKEGMLAFRPYRDDEAVDERDLVSTRKFLDDWGLLDGRNFDAFVQQVPTPA